VPLPGEASTTLWARPSEYPSLLLGPRRVEADIAREWAALVRPGEAIFDVGANIGFTVQRFYALLQGRCHIWAFEPIPRNLELLERNVAGLQDSVTIVRSAVGDFNGTALLQDNLHHGGLSRLKNLSDIRREDANFWRVTREVEVPMLTLDDYVAGWTDTRPTFVKLDVEGAGHWVMSGATRLLSRYTPVVSCSFHSTEEQEGILRVLGAHGYRGVKVLGNGTCHWCDLTASTGNFVHPSDERARSFLTSQGQRDDAASTWAVN
jgi:FkbM family methyltransferase